MTRASSQRLRQILLVVMFLVSISVHWLDTLFHVDPSPPLRENRLLAPWLGWDLPWAGMPNQFEEFFNDHFGFRSTLIRWNHFIKVIGLGTSSLDWMVIGKRDQLYLVSDALARSPDHLVKPDTISYWYEDHQAAKREASRLHIRYLLVAAPVAASIHSENLPDWAQRTYFPAVLDQFLAYKDLGSDPSILDLRPALQEAKLQGYLYRLTDTHWNDLGAHAAYESIVARVRTWFPETTAAWPLSDFSEEHVEQPGGDLAVNFALGEYLTENVPHLVPRRPRQALLTDSKQDPGGERTFMRFRNANSPGPRAVMIHDSFTYVALYPFLAEHFAQIDFHWYRGNQLNSPKEMGALDPEAGTARGSSPELVIREVVERVLHIESEARRR